LPKIDRTCTRCGECIATCPHGAIAYTFVGDPVGGPVGGSVDARDNRPWWRRLLRAPVMMIREMLEARTLFVFTAILFGATISGKFVTRTIAALFGLF
jgi:ferredoxin